MRPREEDHKPSLACCGGDAGRQAAGAPGAAAIPGARSFGPLELSQLKWLLPCSDVAALGATCRALRAACSDGEVWRLLLRRAFPASPLVCAELADYQVRATAPSALTPASPALPCALRLRPQPNPPHPPHPRAVTTTRQPVALPALHTSRSACGACPHVNHSCVQNLPPSGWPAAGVPAGGQRRGAGAVLLLQQGAV